MPHKLRENNFAVQVCTQDIAKHQPRPAGIQLCIRLITICIKRRFVQLVDHVERHTVQVQEQASLQDIFSEHFWGTSNVFILFIVYFTYHPGLATNSIFLQWFCKKSLICLEGKSFSSNHSLILFRSPQQLPRLRLGPLKGFLSWHSALQGPSSCLVRCFWNYRDTRTPSGVPR